MFTASLLYSWICHPSLRLKTIVNDFINAIEKQPSGHVG